MNPEKRQKVEPIIIDTYLAVIKNSIGSNMFRNNYAKVDGDKKDIVEDGELSCAFYVSSILIISKLIKGIHATVSGTVRDMMSSGWIEIDEPKIGCVVVWEKIEFENDGIHSHIGFYIGNDKAISNNYKSGQPYEHDYRFRKIEKILWHPNLEDK